MKINNKKGNVPEIMITLMVIGLLSIIFIIIGLLVYVIGNDYVMIPLLNASQTFNASEGITTGFNTVANNYHNMELSFMDDVWLFVYILVSIAGFVMSYKSKGDSPFTFLSMLTYGLMLILFIGGFFATIMSWLYYELLMNLFINYTPNLPKLAYYISNYGVILLLQSGLMLLLRTIDFDFRSLNNRRKNEIQSLNDDELI